MRNYQNTQTNEDPNKNEDDDDSSDDSPCFVMTEQILSKRLVIDLSEEVHNYFKYIDILKVLRDLPAKTTEVHLNLASYGGYLDGGRPLFNAFKQCSVPVHVNVVGDCYSMGAILALCGTTLTLAPDATLMYHNYSGGSRGKGKELLDGIKESNESIWRWFSNTMQPFLTTAEIRKLKHDGDVYIHEYDEDVKRRIKRHFKGRA